MASINLVTCPDPTPKRRKGSGDIGADCCFCKLSNHVIICIEIETPAYIFEFLTRFSKLKPDRSIQRHREGVTKQYFRVRSRAD